MQSIHTWEKIRSIFRPLRGRFFYIKKNHLQAFTPKQNFFLSSSDQQDWELWTAIQVLSDSFFKSDDLILMLRQNKIITIKVKNIQRKSKNFITKPILKCYSIYYNKIIKNTSKAVRNLNFINITRWFLSAVFLA
jgi:hypothetical protein